MWSAIGATCEDMGLDAPNQLDFGMVDIAYEWARGEALSKVLDDTDMTGGDFVRSCKRLADILGQVAQVGPYLPTDGFDTAETARIAASMINRGIVAYSGVD